MRKKNKTPSTEAPDSKMTDAWLQSLYVRYNRRFWGGRLQGWSVRWAGAKIGRLHACHVSPKRVREFEQAFGPEWQKVLERIQPLLGATDPVRCEITVDVSLRGEARSVRIVLLHEMCHAATKSRKLHAHGRAWEKEITRIVNLGAPTLLLNDCLPWRGRLAHSEELKESSPRRRGH